MERLTHIEDCVIVRPDSKWKAMARKGQVRLCANDREFSYYNFPDDFTDEQIRVALDFANKSYSSGITMGTIRKEDEIKKALGL